MGVWNYFVLTLLLELPIVLLFFKGEWKFALLIGFLLNLFTWPLLHVLLFYTGIDINILEIGVAITAIAMQLEKSHNLRFYGKCCKLRTWATAK